MRSTHNIIGSEAGGTPLIDFCHVHGSIRMFTRRRRGVRILIPFLFGAAFAALAFILARS